MEIDMDMEMDIDMEMEINSYILMLIFESSEFWK